MKLFPPTLGQHCFVLVVIEYFTKCIQVKPLARITTKQVQFFLKEHHLSVRDPTHHHYR